MFILHTSNKTENLLLHLTTVLAATPLSSPFAKEIFLIQSQGMERWLAQQLAERFNVWGNFECLFPGSFFSILASAIDSHLDDTIFDRELIMWRIDGLLRELEDDEFAPLRHFIAGSNPALKRFQLAKHLAQLFDQYQIMRPDMLDAWQQGHSMTRSDSEIWQRSLWQKLILSCGDQHRGKLWQQAIDKMTRVPENSLADHFPERISIFGVNTMPPLFLSFLQGIARHTTVHLFLLNPAKSYWADLENKRRIARRNLQYQENDSLQGHPLLATLGQQGRDFQQLLLELADFHLEYSSFENNSSENNNQPLSVLRQLQNDILENSTQMKTITADDSIGIHACHSRMREVQVLKNQLLDTLEHNPLLELRDIVVMAPEISDYAPYIDAVFDDIPHAVADRNLRLDNALLDCFIRFIHLSQSRLGWQSVMDLLEQPVIYTRFGLSVTDLERLRHWINDTCIRWGRSAQHRRQLGLPALTENTWQAGLERLLMGYAIAHDDFVDDILPYTSVEGTSAQALGGLDDFLHLLFQAANDLSTARSLKTWSEQLYHYADSLFADSEVNAAERQQLNELISKLEEKFVPVHDHDVELEVILAWFESTLQETKSANGFLRGQLTFCSMLPMRSIPFQVIALLGMNEGEFPKVDRHPTFDLLGKETRMGDRSRRTDDRYQFLEILLSARQQLIITYTGRSIKDNKPIPPSVIVSELLDVLNETYQLSKLTIEHPLQAFSPRYFNGNEALFSYSEADFDTAVTLNQRDQQPTPWWHGKHAVDHPEIIELNELFSYFRHPQKHFLQQQLDITLQGIESLPEEREPFDITGLDAYLIHQQWLEQKLQNKSLSLKRLQAQGRWLSGVCGAIEFDKHEQAIENFANRVKDCQAGPRQDDLLVDLKVGRYRLLGKLGNLYEHGGLFYRYAELKGKDFLQAWLHHLLINRHQTHTTQLLSKEESILFLPEHCHPGILEGLIELYLHGRASPYAFFTEPALAYIQQALKLDQGGKANKEAIVSARETLQNTLEKGYDAELSQVLRGVDNIAALLDDRFAGHCENLLLPAWEATHGH